jgi:hypothetical protein
VSCGQYKIKTITAKINEFFKLTECREKVPFGTGNLGRLLDNEGIFVIVDLYTRFRS